MSEAYSGLAGCYDQFTGDVPYSEFADFYEGVFAARGEKPSLLLDLEKFGLLDRTVVLCGGEFGRTPRIAWGPPWNGGRGHWGDAFSYLVAGGGFRGGAVVGKTDAKGEQVVDRPVYPADLWASVYSLMGIDPKRTVVHPTRGEIPILPSFGIEGQSGGMLTEIMR